MSFRTVIPAAICLSACMAHKTSGTRVQDANSPVASNVSGCPSMTPSPTEGLSGSVAAVVAAATGAPTWSRIDNKTIGFQGYITSSADLDGLNAILQSGDQVVVVNFGGGDVATGISLGQRLAPLKLTVVVKGICASSCANYLFTAGAQKQIQQGWVGFHGNMTAGLGVGWAYQLQELKCQGVTDAAQIAGLRQQFTSVSAVEQAYLASVGVSQALFDRSQVAADSGSYGFLCPTNATFSQYGIHNVTGQQDPTFGVPTSQRANAFE